MKAPPLLPLLLPLFWFLPWHGWLLPLPSWAPPEHPLIAIEERVYRNTDPEGYLRFIEVTRVHGVEIRATDKASSWFAALPDFMRGARMFVWDTPTIWINGSVWTSDPGKTVSVIEHELVHVLSRWHPEELLQREGIAGPAVDIADWRTWAEQEVYAANVQLRVAKRLGSPDGVNFALYVARVQMESMGPTRRARFLEAYDWWLDPQITQDWK